VSLEVGLFTYIASTTIAFKMLYDSVKDIIKNPNHIRDLVSRDTENLSSSTNIQVLKKYEPLWKISQFDSHYV